MTCEKQKPKLSLQKALFLGIMYLVFTHSTQTTTSTILINN